MNYIETAKTKIEWAKAALESDETFTLHESKERLAADGITGYQARQIDGMTIDAYTHVDTDLKYLAIDIRRQGYNKRRKQWDEDALTAYGMIHDFSMELAAIYEPDDDEYE
jgi:hypothetical protein